MRTIIAGSQNFQDYDLFCKVMEQYRNSVTAVICGEANGPDRFGRRWAVANNIPVESYPADWKKGKQAGKERNVDMANVAEQLIDFWDGESPGSKHMISTARNKGLKVTVINVHLVSSETTLWWDVSSICWYGY